MSRVLTVGAAQLGPIQRADSRAAVVERIDRSAAQAASAGASSSSSPSWR